MSSSSASAHYICLSASVTSPVQHRHRRLGGGRLSFSTSGKAVAPPLQAPRPSAEPVCSVCLLWVLFPLFIFTFFFLSFFFLQHAVEQRQRVGRCVLPDDMHRLKRLTYHDVCGVKVAVIYSPYAAI